MLPLYKRESDWMSIQPLEVANSVGREGGGGGKGCWSEKESPDLGSPEVGISAL